MICLCRGSLEWEGRSQTPCREARAAESSGTYDATFSGWSYNVAISTGSSPGSDGSWLLKTISTLNSMRAIREEIV